MKKKDCVSFIGYSGHSYVCIEIALVLNYDINGYYDISRCLKNPYNLNYLGSENNFDHFNELFFCSIGDNNKRQAVINKMSKKSKNSFITLIHPQAIISDSVKLSENILVSANAIINANANIEKGCIINSGSIIEHECHIKQFAHIAPGAILAGNVTIGRRSFIGGNSFVKQVVKICDDVIIGAGSTVLKDITKPGTYIGSPVKLLN